MGILVPNCTLPNGIEVSNVFMCFTGENVIVGKDISGNAYSVTSNYRVYKDSSRSGPNIIRCDIMVDGISNISQSPYTYLYNSLKTSYPGAIDETQA
jgi:hypothetical protein